MKTKIKTLTLVFTIVLLLFGCSPATFNRVLLNPTSGTVSPKLPRLDLVRSDMQNSSGEVRSVTSNTYMYTLFQRELPNICEEKGEVRGEIEPVIIINDYNANITPFLVSSVLLWIPQVFGAPIGKDTYQLEVEFVIKDVNAQVIWRKSYFEEDKRTVGFYYGNDQRGDERMILLYREMVQEFKRDIQSDIKDVTAALRSN